MFCIIMIEIELCSNENGTWSSVKFISSAPHYYIICAKSGHNDKPLNTNNDSEQRHTASFDF